MRREWKESRRMGFGGGRRRRRRRVAEWFGPTLALGVHVRTGNDHQRVASGKRRVMGKELVQRHETTALEIARARANESEEKGADCWGQTEICRRKDGATVLLRLLLLLLRRSAVPAPGPAKCSDKASSTSGHSSLRCLHEVSPCKQSTRESCRA
jgi:hypothetical protein